jgi:hypothetical protein
LRFVHAIGMHVHTYTALRVTHKGPLLLLLKVLGDLALADGSWELEAGNWKPDWAALYKNNYIEYEYW